MKSYFLALYYWIVRPFTNHFPYLGLIFLLCTFPYVYHFVSVGAIPYAGFLSLHCWAMTYFLVLLSTLLPSYIRKIYQVLLFFISCIFFLRDYFVAFEYGFDLQANLIAIIQGTNVNEAIEYMNMYFTYDKLLLLTIGAVVLVVVYLILKKIALWVNAYFVMMCFGLLCLGSILTVFKPEVWRNALIGKVYTIIETSSTPDLKDYLSNPNLVHTEENKPDNLVLILGESLAKCQCSLYGYHLNTNPGLMALSDSTHLFIYNNVTSAAISTIPCFQTMMSTYRMSGNTPWYQCITLQEILRISGYHTEWISNQQAYGIWDNVVSKYAELCDTCIFMNRYASSDCSGLDERLIVATSERLQSQEVLLNKNVFFIHLMGSHPQFNKRYPNNFEKFNSNDYLSFPINQRQTLAEYDNSVLYNDSVVCELMNLFKERDALVLYLSDHGMDIYKSRADYIGHADLKNPQSVAVGKQIPFMFYMTDKFIKNHPRMVSLIKANVDQSYCTENLLYTLMDIIGVKFECNEDVSKYSLFHSEKIKEKI